MAHGKASQPDWLEPELATLTQDRFSDPAWLYERKFDGERCLAYSGDGRLRLMTRNQKEVSGTYPELAAALPGTVGSWPTRKLARRTGWSPSWRP